MKTKNLITGIAIVLQMSVTLLSLIAQESKANAYSVDKEKQFKKYAIFAPEFAKTKKMNHIAKAFHKNEALNLQDWMLNPAGWTKSEAVELTNESFDPEVSLEDWMLNPNEMMNTNSILVEESKDAEIELSDWMLNPDKMLNSKSTESEGMIALDAWMLNPTKW